MKPYLYMLLLLIPGFVKNINSQEINPLDFFPYHVGDVWQYVEYPSGIFRTGQITQIDTLNKSTHLLYYENNETPSEKVLTDSAIVLADPNSWFLLYKLSYPVSSIWIRDTTTSWWVHFKAKYTAEVFNENRAMREYHIYEYSLPGDTTGLPGSVEYLVRGIGLYRITWEGGEIILTGCIINGVQYGTIVNVEEVVKTPNEFHLSQNYPNPFNPITNIRFRTANFGFVSLKVYDVLGNEIRTLVNEEKPAGESQVKFDGRNLASGIYLYQLKTDGKIISKKMILIK